LHAFELAVNSSATAVINKGVVGGICIPYEFIIDSYKQRRVVVCKGRELVENQREEL
jgi:hypothetical protein|tara:strand:- start:234 stop:404 length:171 start_codon:yes stop_codon:yes gene_type:complete